MSDHQRLVSDITRHLDRRVTALDGATATRLAAARRAALEDRRPHSRRGLPALAGGLASAGVAALAAWLWLAPASAPPPLEASDLELLTSEDYETIEQLDFVMWLGTQDEMG